MVVGNPDDFSIMFDVVDEWNYDKSFNNGLLFMSIDGKIFLSELTTATLNVELPQLIKNLKSPAENKEIFHMEKKEAFAYIYELTFPLKNYVFRSSKAIFVDNRNNLYFKDIVYV